MRRFAIGIALLLALLLGVTILFRIPLTLRLMERSVTSNLGHSWLDDLPDGLHLVLCGAGSPLPDPRRSGPCVAIAAGDRLVLVDVGSGASRGLGELDIDPGRIDAVLLTHFHSDHIDGLGELLLQRWVNRGAAEPVPIHGPTGVEEVVEGIRLAYRLDRGYRVAHHGEDVVPEKGAGGVAVSFDPPAPGRGHRVLEEAGLRVTAFRVDHAPVHPAVGYRFEYRGRSIVVSGDTVKSANLQHFAAGVDLLVHEALAPHLVEVLTRSAVRAERPRIATITRDILGYHTSPVEAAEVARDAGVGFLLFYHIVPPLPLAPLEEAFVEGVDDIYAGPVAVGRDGTSVHLPAGSSVIRVEERR